MFDVLLRACTNPTAYAGVLKKHTLVVVAVHDLGSNTMAFDLKPTRPCTWVAGQHGIFSLPQKAVDGKTWRVFSIASAPCEGFIRIATTFPPEPSSYKQALRRLVPGDIMTMRGPIGEMHLEAHPKHTVAIAGGIGITPFRAMLAEFAAGLHPDYNFELVYGGKENFYAFEGELRQWNELPNVNIHFLNTPDEINTTLDAIVAREHNNAQYFISGSPGMITAIKKRLCDQDGVAHVVNDPFKGY